MEASTNTGKTAWPWTNEYIWKDYGCCYSHSRTGEDQNADPFDIWKRDLWPQQKKLLCFTKQSTIKHIARENDLNAKYVLEQFPSLSLIYSVYICVCVCV